MKKFLVLVMFILMTASVFGQVCVYQDTASSLKFNNMLNGTYQYFTENDPDIKVTINRIMFNDTTLTKNVNYTFTLNNASGYQLEYLEFVNASFGVFNVSNNVQLGSGNYTITTGGFITWNNPLPLGWNGTSTYFNYTTTYSNGFNLTTNYIDGTKWISTYSPDSTGAYGEVEGWKIYDTYDELNNTDWMVYYTSTERTCSADGSGCYATQTIIYSAFALISVMLIVAVGFGLVNFFGSGGSGDLMLLAVTGIGLAIVLFVGYLIVGQVAILVCGMI